MDRSGSEWVIEVRDLVRVFGAQRALDGLALEVRAGECLGLLGPNGAGKTTTIRILSTLCGPSAGTVRVFGLDPVRDAVRVRARIGVVPQELALYGALAARENLSFFGRLYAVPRERLGERIAWALAQAGLQERADDRVATFSGGMKRRLNIVAALLHEPELVFLDEPTVGVDPQSRNHVFEMVEGLRRLGATLVYTTHQLGEVERLCDRIVILDHGRAVAQGTLAELQSAGSMRGPTRTRFAVGSRRDEVRALLEERGIAYALEDDAPGLEEIFLSLTGRALRDEP